jgi:hypothetical protein
MINSITLHTKSQNLNVKLWNLIKTICPEIIYKNKIETQKT